MINDVKTITLCYTHTHTLFLVLWDTPSCKRQSLQKKIDSHRCILDAVTFGKRYIIFAVDLFIEEHDKNTHVSTRSSSSGKHAFSLQHWLFCWPHWSEHIYWFAPVPDHFFAHVELYPSHSTACKWNFASLLGCFSESIMVSKPCGLDRQQRRSLQAATVFSLVVERICGFDQTP